MFVVLRKKLIKRLDGLLVLLRLHQRPTATVHGVGNQRWILIVSDDLVVVVYRFKMSTCCAIHLTELVSRLIGHASFSIRS